MGILMEKQLPIQYGWFGQITENTKIGAAVKKHTPLSLSIQREIEKHRLNIESEIDYSMGKLGLPVVPHHTVSPPDYFCHHSPRIRHINVIDNPR